MLNFYNYKIFRLGDVANIDRAKKGKIYPAGTVYIQVSATHGQIYILNEPSEIETKFATIIPKDNKYIPMYFKIALETQMPEQLQQYQTGINIQIDMLKEIDVMLHQGKEEQLFIASIMAQYDKTLDIHESYIKRLEDFKTIMIEEMMSVPEDRTYGIPRY